MLSTIKQMSLRKFMSAWTFYAAEIAKWKNPEDPQTALSCARAFLPWTPMK
jgi:hypothetical protein